MIFKDAYFRRSRWGHVLLLADKYPRYPSPLDRIRSGCGEGQGSIGMNTTAPYLSLSLESGCTNMKNPSGIACVEYDYVGGSRGM
jgi:hypothetical protein